MKSIVTLLTLSMLLYTVPAAIATHDGVGICVAGIDVDGDGINDGTGGYVADLFGAPLPDVGAHGTTGFTGVTVWSDGSVTFTSSPDAFEQECCAALGLPYPCFSPVD